MTNEATVSFAKRYARAICHLNRAQTTSRLGLILGAGISGELRIPRWTDLVCQLDQALNYDSAGAPDSYRAAQPSPHFFSCDSKAVGLDAKSPRHLQREAGPTDRVIPRVT